MAVAPEIMMRDAWLPEPLAFKRRAWTPRTPFGEVVRDCLEFLPLGLAAELLDRVSSVVVMHSSLYAVHIRPGAFTRDLGEVSHHVITDTGVAFLVDAWQNTTELENLKYHGVGTGTTAEAASQTGLVTEATTTINPDSTRATGSLTEGGTANVFRSVGTVTFDGTAAITEHGIFSQAATGGGVMIDRSLTGAQTLSSGDSLQSTYTLTFTSGG